MSSISVIYYVIAVFVWLSVVGYIYYKREIMNKKPKVMLPPDKVMRTELKPEGAAIKQDAMDDIGLSIEKVNGIYQVKFNPFASTKNVSFKMEGGIMQVTVGDDNHFTYEPDDSNHDDILTPDNQLDQEMIDAATELAREGRNIF